MIASIVWFQGATVSLITKGTRSIYSSPRQTTRSFLSALDTSRTSLALNLGRFKLLLWNQAPWNCKSSLLIALRTSAWFKLWPELRECSESSTKNWRADRLHAYPWRESRTESSVNPAMPLGPPRRQDLSQSNLDFIALNIINFTNMTKR